MCSSRDLFRQTVFHECGSDINCPLDCGLRVKNFIIPESKPKNRAALLRFFSSNKSAPANRKTGFFYANREPNKQEVGFIFALSASEL
jgi:hypothetical protein